MQSPCVTAEADELAMLSEGADVVPVFDGEEIGTRGGAYEGYLRHFGEGPESSDSRVAS